METVTMAWTEYTNGLFSLDDFDNVEYGGHDNDQLTGDFISTCPSNALCIVGGYSASDYLEGNLGDDILKGGGNDDVLVGVDPDYSGSGTGEYDRLNGGQGYNTFVLGDSVEAYYLENGYAIIEDFDQAFDMLAVHGSFDDYTLTTGLDVEGGTANDTILEYQGDWIAVLEDTTVNLNTDDLIFI